MPISCRLLPTMASKDDCIATRRFEVLGQQTSGLLKPLMVGENALDRERIWQRLWDMGRMGTEIVEALTAFDVALWDLAAKAAGVPLYKHLGAYRDKVPAYASTFTQGDGRGIPAAGHDCVERGYKAIKLHAFGDVKKDIEACRVVRDAVGDDIELMLDASAAYTFEEALWAGRELEKLNYYWLEEPLRDYENHGDCRNCTGGSKSTSAWPRPAGTASMTWPTTSRRRPGG